MTEEQREKKNASIVEWRRRQSPEKKAARVDYERQRQRNMTEVQREAQRKRNREARAARASCRDGGMVGRPRLSSEARLQRRLESRNRWIENNPEKRKEASRKYYANRTEERKEAGRKWHREWSKKNLDKRIALNHRRRARLAGVEGSHTAEEWKAVIASHDHRCAHCLRPDSEVKLTRDHVVPIIKGGSNWIDNIQPLCLSCNCKNGGS